MKANILAIDLEPDSEIRLKIPLTRVGYSVEIVTSEIEIIPVAKKTNYDLILFNPSLRNTNEFDVLVELTSFAKSKGAAVVVVSSSSDRTKIQRSVAAGAVDYLVMPCLPDEIVNRIERNLPIRCDWTVVRDFLGKLNIPEPRILETPTFKSFKEGYLAYPASIGSRSLCILVAKDLNPKQISELSEPEGRSKVFAYRKYSVKWEQIWPP